MDGVACIPSSLLMLLLCMAHSIYVMMNVSELKFQMCAIRVSISRSQFLCSVWMALFMCMFRVNVNLIICMVGGRVGASHGWPLITPSFLGPLSYQNLISLHQHSSHMPKRCNKKKRKTKKPH